MKDLYKILGIEKTATQEEIKKAYFKMAKKYHPDAVDKNEIQKFYEVAEAYQILSNTEERRAYDLSFGGGKIEKILVDEVPEHPTIFKNEGTNADADAYRIKEMRSFKRRILLQGIFRVIGFSLLMSVFGFALSFILEGILYVGLICGFVVGFLWSINSNFDIESFIESQKKRRIIKLCGLILLIGCVGYFGILIIFRILNL
ncbi:J domain-containing protein [Candidatus Peregrinibacteria bacterium]|nr:J domain-containing protein [Candidatus Peregrinibacteria bacterium]